MAGNSGAGVFEAHLVGESHYQAAVAEARFRDPVVLVAEPANPHDPRAVRAIDAKGRTLGYIERGHWLQRVVADEGKSVEARVAEVLGGTPDAPMRGILLHVRADETAGPRPGKRGCGFYAGVGAGVLVALFVIGALITPAPEGGSTAGGGDAADEVVLEATAQVLADSYEANEVNAQRIYGDLPIRVTGTIEAVELDVMDDPVVRLETGKMFRWVSAHFDDAQANATASLNKGQQVTLRCERVIEVLGSPQLQDCVVE